MVAIIQARMESTRLPGKVLMELAGQPMLARVVARSSRARNVGTVVVATTIRPADDAVISLGEKRGWSLFRGSAEDVLDRYYQAASAFRADVVVRITADCPLVEPEIIDRAVAAYLSRYPEIDYVSNTVQRSFPRGLDTEVVGFAALERAWREDKDTSRREHVTPYLWRQPDSFKIGNVTSDVDYSGMRWTVDTIEDLTFVRKIYDHFRGDGFGWKEVVDLLRVHSEWRDINRNITQKAVPS
ncbi:cytidylyltransferase domain-containing protein [Chloroflexota bacterium]